MLFSFFSDLLHFEPYFSPILSCFKHISHSLQYKPIYNHDSSPRVMKTIFNTMSVADM